jgi:serine protease Do
VTGALVASVTPDSPAAQAGIKQGDVITAAGGHVIKNVHDPPRLVAATPVGSKLRLTIVRDGKQRTVEASIGEMPQNVASEERETAQPGSGKTANALGMELLALDPQLRKELKVPKDLNGVVVGQVARAAVRRASWGLSRVT